jgi:hypothetical protein
MGAIGQSLNGPGLVPAPWRLSFDQDCAFDRNRAVGPVSNRDAIRFCQPPELVRHISMLSYLKEKRTVGCGGVIEKRGIRAI